MSEMRPYVDNAKKELRVRRCVICGKISGARTYYFNAPGWFFHYDCFEQWGRKNGQFGKELEGWKTKDGFILRIVTK